MSSKITVEISGGEITLSGKLRAEDLPLVQKLFQGTDGPAVVPGNPGPGAVNSNGNTADGPAEPAPTVLEIPVGAS